MTQMKNLRLKLNKTQAEAAKVTGISIRGYRRIENGENEPRLKTAKALELFYGKSIEYLLKPFETE